MKRVLVESPFAGDRAKNIAYALGKKIVPVANMHPEKKGKSYWKAVLEWRPMFCRACDQSEDACRANKVCEKSLDNKHDVGVHF